MGDDEIHGRLNSTVYVAEVKVPTKFIRYRRISYDAKMIDNLYRNRNLYPLMVDVYYS